MASTYSSNLRLELIATGEQSGTWGATTNTNLGTLLEEAIGGYVSVAVTDGADTVLTTNNGLADQARNMTINLTGTLSASRNVIVPAIEKIYVIKNATSGGYDVTVKVTGQTGVSVPNGTTMLVYVDGTDVRQANIPVSSSGAGVISATDNTYAALRITQLGTGNAITVEDEANPDSTPFVVDSAGRVGIGTSSTLNGNFEVKTILNWNYSPIDINRASTNTATPRFMSMRLDGDSATSTTIGAYNSIWGSYDSSPTTGSTSAALNGAMLYGAYAGHRFYTNGTERIRIDSSGNVGIGTSSPVNKLDIVGNTNCSIASTAQYFGINATGVASSVANGLFAPSGNTLAFTTNSTERIRIDSSGNVGIGTSSPTAGGKLDVSGIAYFGTGDKVKIYSNNVLQNAGTLDVGTLGSAALNFLTNNATRATISSSGNVGLGTTSPAERLHVSGSSYLQTTSGSVVYIRNIGSENRIDSYDNPITANYPMNILASTLKFSTSDVERMRIDSSGNVAVGTSSPGAKFDVYGSIRALAAGGGSSGALVLRQNSTDTAGAYIQWVNHANNAQKGYIFVDTSGNMVFSSANYFFDANTLNSLGTYTYTASGSTVIVTSSGEIRRTSSSIKYKKDIENLDPALADNAIANLRPVWYRTKNAEGDDKETWSHIGLIAEEVDQVEKRLVRYRTVEVTKDENGNRVETVLENPTPEDVDYARLSVLLLDKVKRLETRIAALEAL